MYFPKSKTLEEQIKELQRTFNCTGLGRSVLDSFTSEVLYMMEQHLKEQAQEPVTIDGELLVKAWDDTGAEYVTVLKEMRPNNVLTEAGVFKYFRHILKGEVL